MHMIFYILEFSIVTLFSSNCSIKLMKFFLLFQFHVYAKCNSKFMFLLCIHVFCQFYL
jgi:hypothetical protein